MTSTTVSPSAYTSRQALLMNSINVFTQIVCQQLQVAATAHGASNTIITYTTSGANPTSPATPQDYVAQIQQQLQGTTASALSQASWDLSFLTPEALHTILLTSMCQLNTSQNLYWSQLINSNAGSVSIVQFALDYLQNNASETSKLYLQVVPLLNDPSQQWLNAANVGPVTVTSSIYGYMGCLQLVIMATLVMDTLLNDAQTADSSASVASVTTSILNPNVALPTPGPVAAIAACTPATTTTAVPSSNITVVTASPVTPTTTSPIVYPTTTTTTTSTTIPCKHNNDRLVLLSIIIIAVAIVTAVVVLSKK